MRASLAIQKLLGILGALSLAIVVIGGALLLNAVRRGFGARDEPSTIEAALAKKLRSWSVPIDAKGARNPVPNGPEVLANARAHWADHCAICHANNGSGDTTLGRNLYPRAPDMRLSATQKLGDGELFYIIQNGIRLSGMPAWAQTEGDAKDSWTLVHFIRHLPALTDEEIQEMERLNPKSAHEREEEQQEEEFLKGGEPKPQLHETERTGDVSKKQN